jgi:uncharacterized protein (TIGR03000 family)
LPFKEDQMMKRNVLSGVGVVCVLLAMGWIALAQDGRPEPPGLPPLPGDQKPGVPDKKPEAPKPPVPDAPSPDTKPGTAPAKTGEVKPAKPATDAPLTPPPDLPADTPPRVPAAGVPAAPPAPLKPAVTGQPATINVQCPANASIWIEGQKMSSTGAVRAFQSPPLEPGRAFYYTFKVSWPTAPGQPDQVLEQEVTVRGGQTSVLDFRPQQTQQPVYSPPFYQPQPSRPPIFRRPEGSGYRY